MLVIKKIALEVTRVYKRSKVHLKVEKKDKFPSLLDVTKYV